MPTYVYRCQADHEFEAVQPITDRALSVCVVCGAPVRRVVMPVGIVFKGSGFYKTDSRGSETASSPATPPATKPAESGATTNGATPEGGSSAPPTPAATSPGGASPTPPANG